jgi:hypothetical protein
MVPRIAPRSELQLALSELPDEKRPTTVARFLLPDGVRLEQGELELGRPELPGHLGRLHAVTIARNLRLEMPPNARARLAQLGHDPKLGARPLRRTLEDLVVAPSPTGWRALRPGAMRPSASPRTPIAETPTSGSDPL